MQMMLLLLSPLLYTRYSMYRRASKGFALPTIVISSVILFAVLVSSMGVASSMQATLRTQYNEALSRDAAESGVAYAKYCYKKIIR